MWGLCVFFLFWALSTSSTAQVKCVAGFFSCSHSHGAFQTPSLFLYLLVFVHWAGGRRAIWGSCGYAPSWCRQWGDAVHLGKLSLWIEQDIYVWKMMCCVFLQLSVTWIHVLLACSSMSPHHIQVLSWCWYFLLDYSKVQPLFGCHHAKTLCMSLSHILWHVVQGQKMFRICLPMIK